MVYTTLSIIIPTYNEEKTIAHIWKQIKDVPLTLKKEIIIVDDGSTDGTRKILQHLCFSDKETKVILQDKNQGKGAAIRRGLDVATGEITLIQDADLEYDPCDYQKLIAPLLSGNAQVVYGSRRLKKTNEQYAGITYYIGGIGLTKITNLLYGSHLTDEATCYKVFTTALLKDLHLECIGFEFCPEVTAKILRRKIPIVEVPISYYPRSTAEGKKIRWKDGVHAVWVLLKYRFI